MALLVGLSTVGDGPAPPSAQAFDALGDEAVQDLLILGETRPIILRMRVKVGDRAFRAAWSESFRALHARLDRDGDGKLTVKEADETVLSMLLGQAGSTPAARGRIDLDRAPKDGVVTVDELADVFRAASGPFRVQVDGLTDRRTDPLFDHLDRDKDGQITRAELASITSSLRRLDLDDNELIGADEVASLGAPVVAPTAGMMMNRPTRAPGVPTVVELATGELPARVVRLLLKKYDTGSSRGPGKPDAKLSPEEYAIAPEAFAAADTGGDGTLNAEELRKYLSQAPPDAILDVALTHDAKGRALARIHGVDGGAPRGIKVRQLAEGVVEVDLDPIRLDIHIDDGEGAADAARKTLRAQFEAADANGDGYLEVSELTGDNGQSLPLSSLFGPLDRDGDGKLYPRELDDYVALGVIAARGRLTLTASDEGRAIFGMLDLDRDRQLGAREVLETFARVSACDRDGDGRVAPEEIPHHIQLTLARGDLTSLIPSNAANPAVVSVVTSVVPPRARPAKGPAWFRRMDRNRDGDVSRREFLGTREQFERLDSDHDGLIAPDEAEAARPLKAPGG
jgi:Ca2+-binding EF-hand superfamily protein